MLERMMDRLARRARHGSGRGAAAEPDPAVRRRPRRGHRPDLRQRQLSSAALDKALEHVGYEELREEQAAARKQGPATWASAWRPTSRSAASGRRRSRAPIGFQGGLWESAIVRFHPTGKVQRLHRRVAARPGRGDDVRADCRRRARRRRQRRQGRARRHRQHADGLGHLRQPHDGGRRRGAGDWRRARSRRRRSCLAAHLLEAARRGHRLRRRQVLREGLARARPRRSRTSR